MNKLTILNIVVIVLLTLGCLFAIMTYLNTTECEPLCDAYLEANCPFYEADDFEVPWNNDIE